MRFKYRIRAVRKIVFVMQRNNKRVGLNREEIKNKSGLWTCH
jgi:hypothetical protein